MDPGRGWWGRQRGRGPGAGCGGGPGRPLRCLGLRYAPGRGGVFGVLRLLQQRGVLGAAGQAVSRMWEHSDILPVPIYCSGRLYLRSQLWEEAAGHTNEVLPHHGGHVLHCQCGE